MYINELRDTKVLRKRAYAPHQIPSSSWKGLCPTSNSKFYAKMLMPRIQLKVLRKRAYAPHQTQSSSRKGLCSASNLKFFSKGLMPHIKFKIISERVLYPITNPRRYSHQERANAPYQIQNNALPAIRIYTLLLIWGNEAPEIGPIPHNLFRNHKVLEKRFRTQL
jgi:hypothetical protein